MGISLLRWVDTHPVPFLFPRLHVEFIATAPPRLDSCFRNKLRILFPKLASHARE